MRHRYGEQYARLEAVRAYVQMAGSIMAEFREAEKNSPSSDIDPDKIAELMGDLKASYDDCQDMIDSIAAEAAIEGAEKDTLLPPPMYTQNSRPTEPEAFKPVALEQLDSPFEDVLR